MARPQKKIDPAKILTLAAMPCTVDEIAMVLNCSARTLQRRFADELQRGRLLFNIKLRKMQWQMAEGGSVRMQIWLGENVLGQSDTRETILEGEVSVNGDRLRASDLRKQLLSILAQGDSRRQPQSR